MGVAEIKDSRLIIRFCEPCPKHIMFNCGYSIIKSFKKNGVEMLEEIEVFELSVGSSNVLLSSQ